MGVGKQSHYDDPMSYPQVPGHRRPGAIHRAPGRLVDGDANLTGRRRRRAGAGRAAPCRRCCPRLGVQPALGRNFLPEEAVSGRNRVALISHGLWQRRFGGDDVRSARASGSTASSYRIVGVLPRGLPAGRAGRRLDAARHRPARACRCATRTSSTSSSGCARGPRRRPWRPTCSWWRRRQSENFPDDVPPGVRPRFRGPSPTSKRWSATCGCRC